MTDGPAPADALPRLAYVYQPGSFATLALFGAAQGLCQLVWVVDSGEVDATEARLLRRTGAVVDVAGLSYDEAATLLDTFEFAGVLSLADDKLSWTAEVAERLGLPFHATSTVVALTDKLVQRRALAAAGLSAPASAVVVEGSSRESLAAHKDDLRFPAVLKPRLGEGSRDTVLVASFEALCDELAGTLPSGGAPRDFVLEEYIPDATTALGGEGFAGYVSVESYVKNGSISHLAITGRMPPAFPFRETGFFIPSALEPALQLDVLAAAASAAEAVGVTIGCLHTEVKLTDAGPVIIEVNGRIGGGVPEMLHAAGGVRLLALAMRLALRKPEETRTPLTFERLAFLMYLHAPFELHDVTAVEGLEAIRAFPGVDEVVLRRGPGSHVDWREGNHGHVASVFGTVADHEELRRMNTLINETIRITGA